MKREFTRIFSVICFALSSSAVSAQSPSQCTAEETSWKSSAETILHEIGGDDLQAYFGFTPSIRILDTFTPNAFAIEPGEVVVSQGLLNLIYSPNELAFVIAHELAHLVLGHTHQYQRGGTVSLEEKVLMELEADRVALDLLGRAGNPVVSEAEGFLVRLGGYGKERGTPLSTVFPSLNRRINQFASIRGEVSGL